MKNNFGEDVTFVGFPTENRNGSVFALDAELAISSKCKNKEAAWEFLKYFLSDEYQSGTSMYNLPVSVKALNAKIEEAMKEDDDTIIARASGDLVMTDESYAEQNKPLTQAEADQIMELINSVNQVMRTDNDLETIITEEAESYFAGQKSVQDAASVIQSRASIYISENQ